MKQLTYRLDMVGSEIVHYYNIPRTESGNQDILQICQESISSCSTVEGRIGHFSIQANGGQDRRGLRCVQRRMIYHTLPALPTTIPPGHIDIHSTFIQENQMRCLRFLRKPTPLFSLGLHIGDAPVRKRGSSSFYAGIPSPGSPAAPFLSQPAAPIFLRFPPV